MPGRLDGVGLAHDTVNRADERRTIERHHLVEQRLAIVHRRLLFFRGAAKVPARPHAGAGRPAHEPVSVEFLLYEGWINMGRVLDRDFDGLETPFFERFEKRRALVGEG